MLKHPRLLILSLVGLGLTLPLWAAGEAPAGGDVIMNVGIAIMAATALGFLGHLLKQPLILAYIAAGIIIGPNLGFGIISNLHDIETISHFGLILLLFLIGLEIDVKKLRASGKSLIIGGVTQFPLTALLGVGFFLLLGYTLGGGKYDLLYLAVCLGLSSTAIVVKLLYGKFELDTLAGRLTLGILVFQDIWAIILLGIQPNLTNPDILQILLSFAKGGLLVVLAMVVSRYVLVWLFKQIAKIPELVLVSSLGWCFLICWVAGLMNLSVEMGALIAGIAISTFPYNLDVIAKVVNIRDFFVTLFFVSLGMQVPNPFGNPGLLVMAGVVSLFLFFTRFATVFPVLHGLGNGVRIPLLTSINLAQLSEFSLVIATLGVASGHIGQDTFSIIVFVFVFTSILSTYGIKYSNGIQKFLGKGLAKVGFKEIKVTDEDDNNTADKEIALLGFFRNASSLISEIEALEKTTGGRAGLRDKLVVIDFNPTVHEALTSLGIKVVYGDISHMDTLHHAGIHNVKLVISTIPDTILVGTDNFKIIQHIKDLCPHARIIVTAESAERALKMYSEGADYVFLPRILAAKDLLHAIERFQTSSPEELEFFTKTEQEQLKDRTEIIN